MGQGGTLVLLNATNRVWKRTKQYAHQMEYWKFPYTISPGQTVELYVEWQERSLRNPFLNSEDDRGEATYELENPSQSFEIQATARDGYELRVDLGNVETHKSHNGSNVVSLGWKHNGHMEFVLAGEGGPYTATGLDASKWMSQNLSLLGEKPLSEIAMPGSHNAGLSKFLAKTLFVHTANTITQSRDLKGQLESGARYFDVRPVISAGRFATGHYSVLRAGNVTVGNHSGNLVETWQGGTGQSIAGIIDNVNDFTRDNSELIVLMLSHCLNTDVGNANYRKFTEDENRRLVEELSRLNHLYRGDPDANLAELKLNQFLQDGTAAVVVILENGFTAPPSLQGHGFFESKCYPIYDNYSNTNELDTMINDQLRKMAENNRMGRCFVLSWTLTLQGLDNITPGDSIEELAEEANCALVYRAFRNVSNAAFPSVVYLDFITNSTPAVFCLAAQWKVHLGL